MSISTRRAAGVLFALGCGLLGVPAMAQDQTNPHWHIRPERPWTQGTTNAANEVIGERSGLDFAFLPPGPTIPGEAPIPAVATITAIPVSNLLQVIDLVPPPVNDLPPGPTAVRVRLWPPGPTTPARLEIQILDTTELTILGPTGDPMAVCLPPGPTD